MSGAGLVTRTGDGNDIIAIASGSNPFIDIRGIETERIQASCALFYRDYFPDMFSLLSQIER
jgi:hypothetical protein